VLASTYSYPWPRHLCESQGDEWHRRQPLVSNGPFLLERIDDDRLVMVANPRWTGRRGNLREIEVDFRTHAKTTAVKDLWTSGEVDVLSMPFVPEEDDEACVDLAPTLGTAWIGFRSDRGPLTDVRVRRALAGALAPVARAFPESGLVGRPAEGGGLLPPAMPGHDHHVSPRLDLEGARALLAEAGYPGGAGLPRLRMLVAKGFSVLLDALEAAVAEIGVGLDFTVSERAIRTADDDSDMWMGAWLADYPDPDGFFRGLLEDPCDPVAGPDMTAQLRDLLRRARASRDQDERLELYGRVDRLLVAEWVVLVPLAYQRTTLLRRPWVHGLWANALTPFRLDGVIVDRGEAPPGAAG
jgi:oligopeptide transport system substrate-binding protein